VTNLGDRFAQSPLNLHCREQQFAPYYAALLLPRAAPWFTRLTVTKQAAAAVVACYDGVQQLMKEQVRAIEEAQRPTSSSGAPDTGSNVDQTIRSKCQNQWPNNFRMQAHCELAQGRPKDVQENRTSSQPPAPSVKNDPTSEDDRRLHGAALLSWYKTECRRPISPEALSQEIDFLVSNVGRERVAETIREFERTRPANKVGVCDLIEQNYLASLRKHLGL
jgi:hypothetical protein